MNENFNKNSKVEQFTNMFLSRGEEKGLTVKDPFVSAKQFQIKKINVFLLSFLIE